VHLRLLISEEVQCKSYAQYLGSIDALGTLNSLGHAPEYQPFVHHSTNTLIPLSMQVGKSIV
jgi:hypothetical protein